MALILFDSSRSVRNHHIPRYWVVPVIAFVFAVPAIINGPPDWIIAAPLMVSLCIAALMFGRHGILDISALLTGTLIAGVIYSLGTLITILGLVENSFTFLMSGDSIGGGRFGAFGSDPNISAQVLVLIVGVSIVALSVGGPEISPRLRKVTLWMIVPNVFFTLMSMGRLASGLVAGVALVGLWVLSDRRTRTSLVALTGISIAVGWQFILGLPVFTKEAGTNVGELRSDNLRLALWHRGIEILPDSLPMGVGIGRSNVLNESLVGRPISFHSSWLIVGIELGVPGILVMLPMILAAIVAWIMWARLPGVAVVICYLAASTLTPFIDAFGPFILFLTPFISRLCRSLKVDESVAHALIERSA